MSLSSGVTQKVLARADEFNPGIRIKCAKAKYTTIIS